jgi:hypothetical protein
VTGLEAVQAQPETVLMTILLVPPTDGNEPEPEGGLSEYVQVIVPAWVMVNVWPAAVIVPTL